MAMQPFLWGNNGEMLSPQQVAARRQVAEAIAARGGAPKNVGEGLSRIGDALLYRANMRRAGDAETAGRAHAAELFKGIEGGGADQATLMAALADPWLQGDPGMSSVTKALLDRQMHETDPDAILERQIRERQLAQFDAPDYQMITDPVTGDVSRWNARDPNSKPELFYDAVDKPPAIDIPSGYEPNPDAPGLRPIAGGPADTSAKDAAAATEAAQKSADANDAALASIENSQRAIKTALGQTNGFTAGNAMGRAGWVPFIGQGTTDLSATLDTIKANLSFDRLQAMRDASKTGGALGSVSEGELRLLGSTIASLDPTQSPTQLMVNLAYINQQLEKLKPTAAMPEADENGIVRLPDGTTIQHLGSE